MLFICIVAKTWKFPKGKQNLNPLSYFTGSTYVLSLLPKPVHFFFCWLLVRDMSLYFTQKQRLVCWFKFDKYYYSISLLFLNESGIRHMLLVKERYLPKVKRVFFQRLSGRNTNLHLSEWIPRSVIFKQVLTFFICTLDLSLKIFCSVFDLCIVKSNNIYAMHLTPGEKQLVLQ